MIYADNAATTKMSKNALDIMTKLMKEAVHALRGQ